MRITLLKLKLELKRLRYNRLINRQCRDEIEAKRLIHEADELARKLAKKMMDKGYATHKRCPL